MRATNKLCCRDLHHLKRGLPQQKPLPWMPYVPQVMLLSTPHEQAAGHDELDKLKYHCWFNQIPTLQLTALVV